MRMSYLIYGAMAVGILLVVSALGYLQSQVAPKPKVASLTGTKPTMERQIERRRGAIGTAAIAGTTTQ